MPGRWSRTILAPWLSLPLLLLGLTVLLVQGDWLWRWDRLLYDVQLSLWTRPPPDDVVIVAIDEESLAELGRWPWSRRRHAQLLDRLAADGARVVALDIIFGEPDTLDPGADAQLARALRRGAPAVLPVLMEQPRLGGQLLESLPVPVLAAAAAGLGHVHAELDPDGIARSVYLLEGLGTPRWPMLSVAMLRVAQPGRWEALPGLENPLAPVPGSQVWQRDRLILVPFAGPPGHFLRISYAQVLKGEFAPGTFRDKLVLVGATAAGMGDALPTPVSGHHHPMPGVELNANVLDSLRRGIVITPMAQRWRMVLSALLVLLPGLLYARSPPRASLPIAVLLILATLTLSTALLAVAHVWLPPAAVLFALAISYPLWSWRRLEYAMGYLDQEMSRLHGEQAELPVAHGAQLGPAMSFVSRVLPVAGWVLQDEQGRRVTGWGEVPRTAPAAHGLDTWVRRGQDYWGRLAKRGRQWRVGVRWGDPHSASAEQLRLLAEVVSQFVPAAVARPQGTIEVVHARIRQVQTIAAQLRATRRFVADSLAQMADGVVVVSTLGEVLLANPQAAHYLQEKETALTGRPLLSLLGGVTLIGPVSWQEALRTVLLERRAVQLDARHQGSGRDLLVQIVPLAPSAEWPAGLIVNLSDISALKASERRRSEVLSFLSHDLRSPLVSVLALLELAKQRHSEAHLRELLGRMEEYAAQTLELAEQFLQLARAESNDDLPMHDLDMVGVAFNAFEQAWAQAQARHIELRRRFDVEDAWVRGDAGLLERALVNLLTNAVKYSPDGAAVTLGLSRQGAVLMCWVEDNGPGIAPEDLPRLFDRFQRSARASRRGVRGVGLGLAFVKAVAQRHGGEIQVESVPGRGSRFCLTLPVSAEPTG